MLSKNIHFFILSVVMTTSTTQTTKTAQYPQFPISFLAQYTQVTIPAIQQTIMTILNDHEKNSKNYLNNMNKVQDIFWALKKIDSCMHKQVQITTADIASLEKNLADIQKTNNCYTNQHLLKRQKYIARRLAAITNVVLFSNMRFFDSEDIS